MGGASVWGLGEGGRRLLDSIIMLRPILRARRTEKHDRGLYSIGTEPLQSLLVLGKDTYVTGMRRVEEIVIAVGLSRRTRRLAPLGRLAVVLLGLGVAGSRFFDASLHPTEKS